MLELVFTVSIDLKKLRFVNKKNGSEITSREMSISASPKKLYLLICPIIYKYPYIKD